MPLKRCSRNAGGFFEHVAPRHRIEELDYLAARPDFWNDPQSAATQLAEHARLTALTDRFSGLECDITDLLDLAAIADADLLKEVDRDLAQRIDSLTTWRRDARPSDPLDIHPCFFTLTAGLGGREAQDWTQMLERMYLRWAEANGCRTELIHRETTDSGLRTATWQLHGTGSYGRLRCESGIHRLVRLSPFGAGGRQTSFAAIDVTPGLPPQPETDLLDKDLEISTFRSSGAGGQNVQKVESAVRIRHVPTGIVVACQRERSQHANRKIALAMLQGKLMELKAREASEAQSEREAAKDTAGFGRQLRSYVLHPYTMVKDHRSEHQSSNAAGILDGAIDGFLEAAREA